MLMVHAIWSISTPIALIEACVPERARTPWLGRVGLVVTGIVFLFGAVAGTAIGYRQDHYLASKAQFIWAAVAVVALVVIAFRMPVIRRYAAYRMAPSAWILGAISLAFASADHQPLLHIQPVDPLHVHLVAATAQHSVQPAIAIARLLPGQLHQLLAQRRVAVRSWLVSVG